MTNHHLSLKDDFLNTKYFSNYNRDWDNPPQETDKEKAIEEIERQLEQLKMRQAVQSRIDGVDYDKIIDDMKVKVFREAFNGYETFI